LCASGKQVHSRVVSVSVRLRRFSTSSLGRIGYRRKVVPGESIAGMAETAEEHSWWWKKWNSLWVGIPLWLAASALSIYWYYCVPSPGKAVGALAVVAGIMSVREIKVLGKISWVVILIFMLLIEFRSIDQDRAENDKKQKDFFESQRKGFESISKQAGTNFSATTSGLTAAIEGLNSVLGTTRGVATIAKKNLAAISGGDSFAYLIPHIGSTEKTYELIGLLHPGAYLGFNMSIENQGDQPLTGVNVTISHIVKMATAKERGIMDNGVLKPIDMGTIAPHTGLNFPGYLAPEMGEDGVANYMVYISAQNGVSTETLSFRQSKDLKNYAYKLFVQRTVMGKRRRGDVRNGNGWLRTVKTIDWTEPPI
jgi:hypothetical protein